MSTDPGNAEPTGSHRPAPGQSSPLWYLFIALGLLWMILVYMNQRGQRQPGRPPAIATNGNQGQTDLAFRPRDLEGRPADFAQFRGKVVFLNVWATWCPPCVAEMPSIDRLAANPRLKDVVFACLSVDASAREMVSFAREHKLTVPVYHAGTELPAEFQTEGIPATFIINKQGRIVLAEVGSANWDDESVVAKLEALQSETP